MCQSTCKNQSNESQKIASQYKYSRVGKLTKTSDKMDVSNYGVSMQDNYLQGTPWRTERSKELNMVDIYKSQEPCVFPILWSDYLTLC